MLQHLINHVAITYFFAPVFNYFKKLERNIKNTKILKNIYVFGTILLISSHFAIFNHFFIVFLLTSLKKTKKSKIKKKVQEGKKQSDKNNFFSD